jgi:hypothetical protein
VDFATLVVKMVKTIVENANAQKGTFFIAEEDDANKSQLLVCAEYSYQQRYTFRNFKVAVHSTNKERQNPIKRKKMHGARFLSRFCFFCAHPRTDTSKYIYTGKQLQINIYF